MDKRGRMLVSPGKTIGEKYRVIEGIGTGAYSNVYLCRNIKTQESVIVKGYRSMEEYAESANREIEVMKLLNKHDPENQYFVKYLGNFLYHHHVCMVLQRYGMSLLDAFELRNFRPISGYAIRQVMYKICQSLRVLHINSLIHTDIKLENVLLPIDFDLTLLDSEFPPNYHFQSGDVQNDQDDISPAISSISEPTISSDETPTTINTQTHQVKTNSYHNKSLSIDAKLIDFGSLASGEHWHSNLATTRRYRAPEILMELQWGRECDIWSLGCLLVELATGEISFDSRNVGEKLFLIQHMIGAYPKWMCKSCPNSELRKLFGKCGIMTLGKSLKKKKCDRFAYDKEDNMILETPTLARLLEGDKELADLALRMLKTDPFERLSIDDILNHPFFEVCRC